MKSQRLKLAIGVFGLMAMVTTPAIGVAAEPDWKAVESITEMGQPLLPTMGVVTVMNRQPTADGKAASPATLSSWIGR